MNFEEFGHDVVKKAKEKGASQAECYLQLTEEFSVQVRKGEIEILEQSQGKGLGLRAFVKKRAYIRCMQACSAPPM